MWKQSVKGEKGMRRTMLAVTSGIIGFVLLVLFGVAVLWQCIDVKASALPVGPLLSFPCCVTGADLRVLQLASYEGPYWEDYGDEEVVAVAALLIENTGGYIAQGAVVLEWEDRRMVFELQDIPPGARVLVLEKDKQRFTAQLPTGCYGWEMESYPETMGFVTAENAGGMYIAVINHTEGIVPVAEICYRSCDPGSGTYIGGTSYRVEVRDLQPGERRIISPYHYASGSSEILYVTTWVE
jgi:hypothetical protein